MRKQEIILSCLCIVVATTSTPAQGSRVRKLARIAWYATQTTAGCYLFGQFHSRAMQSLNPWNIARECWRDKKHAGVFGVAAITLLSNGISGLERELQFWKFFKKQLRKKK